MLGDGMLAEHAVTECRNPFLLIEEGMTMHRFVAPALFAAALVLATGNTTRAEDTIRLGGSVHAPTQTLLYNGDADTDLVHRWGWGGYRGYGYRGWGGYGYRGWGGYYGGYRGWGGYYAGYRGWGGYGWGGYGYYRPYYASYGYRPYYNGYYPSYYSGYYSPSYYGGGYYSYPYSSYYYYPCGNGESMPPATVLGSSYYSQPGAYQTNNVPPRPTQNGYRPNGTGDGTFRYDGGPERPLPMPGDEPAPTFQRRPTVPLEGKIVSLPAARPSVTYAAYGEAPRTVTAQPAAATRFVSTTSGTRTTFPAYGER